MAYFGDGEGDAGEGVAIADDRRTCLELGKDALAVKTQRGDEGGMLVSRELKRARRTCCPGLEQAEPGGEGATHARSHLLAEKSR